mmetsp:Transcript_307/g.543  ORF Transcript_307/g.543 Transcript_307/m.543 type:complete len:299 (-) Transcript_307:75-971(-)
MVVLGEDPGVEIRRDVVTNVHFCQLFVVLHLVIWNLDSLLERNGVVVVTGVDGLGNTRVGTVSTNDHVKLQSLGVVVSHGGGLIIRVVDNIWVLLALWQVDMGDKAVDGFGAVLDGSVSQICVEHFSARHTNVLVRSKGLSDIDLAVGRRDHLHLSDLSVNDLGREVEFINHAQRDGATAWLAVIHLSLENGGFHTCLCENLCRACAGWTATDDCDANLHIECRCAADALLGLPGEERAGGRHNHALVPKGGTHECGRSERGGCRPGRRAGCNECHGVHISSSDLSLLKPVLPQLQIL